MKKAQVILEFIFVAGLIFIFVTAIIYFFSTQLRGEKNKVVEEDLISLGNKIKEQIEIARGLENGLNMTIIIPEVVDGENYSLEYVESSIVIQWNGKIFSFDIGKINGTLKKGTNYIIKNESGLYILQ